MYNFCLSECNKLKPLLLELIRPTSGGGYKILQHMFCGKTKKSLNLIPKILAYFESYWNYMYKHSTIFYVDYSTKDGQFVKPPDEKQQKGLLEEIRRWQEV